MTKTECKHDNVSEYFEKCDDCGKDLSDLLAMNDMSSPWFDYAFHAFNPERRLEGLLEFNWEGYAKTGQAISRTHVISASFEF
jgi:hypothetical protein